MTDFIYHMNYLFNQNVIIIRILWPLYHHLPSKARMAGIRTSRWSNFIHYLSVLEAMIRNRYLYATPDTLFGFIGDLEVVPVSCEHWMDPGS